MNSLSRMMTAWLACTLLSTGLLHGEVEERLEGAYEIGVEISVGGTIVERVTIPANTRSDGDLSGLLLLNTKGNAARSWQVDIDSDFNSKEGVFWTVTIRDLQSIRPFLNEGTLRTEPQVVFSVTAKLPADGTLLVYKTLSERLVMTVKPAVEQGGADHSGDASEAR